jgi:hypothetical protein
MKHGKPVASLHWKQSPPQGGPRRWRAEDAGGSKGRPVIGRIEGILAVKAGRLPAGHQSRESMQNHRTGESQMDEARASCAPPNPDAAAWEQIPWHDCERRVRRLQERIVKATRAGRRGKVKSLQWLLTHSFHAKALAVKRVTENKGKHTPGVDGATWRSPAVSAGGQTQPVRGGSKPATLRG